MGEEMHCFNKNNFRPFNHSVTKQYNIKILTKYNRDVTSQSLISHTLWFWFLPIDDGEDGGNDSLSFCSKLSPKTQGKGEDERYMNLLSSQICTLNYGVRSSI